jgi:hypothetical protein
LEENLMEEEKNEFVQKIFTNTQQYPFEALATPA